MTKSQMIDEILDVVGYEGLYYSNIINHNYRGKRNSWERCQKEKKYLMTKYKGEIESLYANAMFYKDGGDLR